MVRSDIRQGQGRLESGITLDGLTASATAQVNWPAGRLSSQFQVALASFTGLSEFVPELRDAQGRLTAAGHAEGRLTALQVEAAVHGQQLVLNDKTVEDVELHVTGETGSSSAELKGSVKNVGFYGDSPSPWDSIAGGSFTLQGARPGWNSNARLEFRNKSKVTYAGFIARAGEIWQIGWDHLVFAPPQGSELRNVKPGSVQIKPDGILQVHHLAMACGAGALSMDEGLLSPTSIDMDLFIKNIAMGPFVQLIPKQGYEGLVNAEVQLKGSRRAPSGIITVDISSGTFQEWSFKGMDVHARFAPPWVELDALDIRMVETGENIHGSGRLPMHLVNSAEPNLPMSLSINAPHLDPLLLAAVVPGLVMDKGSTASLNFKMTGLYPEVSLNGNFTASIPHILVKSAGLDLRDVQADIRSQGKTITIKQFAGKTKKGDLHITGQSTIPHLNFTVEGQKIALNIPKQLEALADVHLVLGGDLQGPSLTGEIKLADTTYTMPVKTKKERQKEQEEREEQEAINEGDVFAATQPAKSSLWEAAAMDVHAQWPGRVYYRDGLTKIETSGDLRVRKDKGADTLYMNGRIDIVRGTFDAYGRAFILDQGNIIFMGPPEINPQLNVEAKYTSGGTVVTLDVKGTAKAPTLSLSSNPPLAQQDIISVLVLGQPLNQVGDQGSSTSRSAQSEALAGSVIGGYVSKELRESGMDIAGLDVVQVQSSPTGGNLLTVGRYIGQKLFVSYGQPLQSSAQRVFDASYYLSPRWTVVGETGEASDSHMDFQFRYPLNTPHYPKEPTPSLAREPQPIKEPHD